MPHTNKAFSQAILDWFDQHGRKDLPWQKDITAYRVWISEIMLQQTQVNTVIPYYQRFMASFPDIKILAAAPLDEVLHHWSGLGYYARARNLHKTAITITEEHQGQLPANVEQLCELPGIGRSTAGAICAIAHHQRASILDGNVKRVLARYQTIDGWPGKTAVSNKLWSLAEIYTPQARAGDYTQAIMDLGATLCTRSKPACSDCPLKINCRAEKLDDPTIYPGKKPKKPLPVKAIQMLIIEHADGTLLLQKRAPQGIWGGLWSFPELSLEEAPQAWSQTQLQAKTVLLNHWPIHRHTFSHYHLDISPVHMKLAKPPQQIMEADRWLWYNTAQPAAIGLATPVSKLIKRLKTHTT